MQSVRCCVCGISISNCQSLSHNGCCGSCYLSQFNVMSSAGVSLKSWLKGIFKNSKKFRRR